MSHGLRLLFYDDTCRTSRFGLGLTHSWIAGARFYGAMGKFHAAQGFTDWDSALDWLVEVERDAKIDEIQFWGHGKWGKLFIDGAPLTADWLTEDPRAAQIRDRLSGPEALWWFRTCETFGAETGHDFARRWTEFFEANAAGHTYIIGPLQSGLHALRPGDEPTWSTFEGLDEGSPEQPTKALWSIPGAPNTISCLRPTLPKWAFSAGRESSAPPTESS